MMIEVQAIGTVKPSSPTPGHLRRHVLSFLDQIAPPIFMPLLLFFPKDELVSNTERCNRIKRTLSEALTQFYPLAGRVKGNSYVDCNDEGAYYAEVRVRCPLSDILESPTPQVMNELLPFEFHSVSDLGAAVQVSLFDCGGLAITLCLSHKIADGQSYITFLNSWAAIARGNTTSITTPCFDSASLFPPIDISGYPKNSGMMIDILTRRFVFDRTSVAALQSRYTNKNSQDRRPTRVEAVSAFIWSRFVASTRRRSAGHITDNRNYTVLHAVNLRARMEPALSECNFGNLSRIAVTMPSLDTIEGGRGHEIVNSVREAIRQVDAEHVRKIQQGEGHLKFMKERYQRISKGEIIPFSFTSLCRLPVYEADFGWGKPVWVGSASLPFKNLVMLLDTKSGDGIEAWCNLKEEDMARFEKDTELQAYVSLSPKCRM